MQIIAVIVAAIAIGFGLGYFFSIAAIVVITIIVVGLPAIWYVKAEELEGVFAMYLLGLVVVMAIAMWITAASMRWGNAPNLDSVWDIVFR